MFPCFFPPVRVPHTCRRTYYHVARGSLSFLSVSIFHRFHTANFLQR